ncbi:MAG: PTS sugar transporter subunit IIA [Deltaproteobacteria bacterium]|nr:PTS sugar transporter subunit IIA [Deltaproteobacteria bacterium]
MKIVDYLDESLVISDLDCDDKDEVLRQFARLVNRRFPELDEDEVYEVLQEREELGSTGIGEGIAIPHGKLKNLETIIAAFARSRRGIDFDAIDGQPVYFFFLLLAPENSAGLHLKALAKISRMLKSKEFREELANAEDEKALFQVISTEDDRF